MFEVLTIFTVDEDVLYRAAELRRKKRMKLGDAIMPPPRWSTRAN